MPLPTAWLPPGKRGAVCFTIDDIHPAGSAQGYDAGGNLSAGALGRVEWLLERHPELRVTLFTTPDWREISALPTRKVLQRIPYLRDRVYLTRIRPRGSLRLDRFPRFVEYLRQLPRTEIGLHGLHHVHVGPRIPVEFQEQGVSECKRMLREAMDIFEMVGLNFVSGMTPPGFNAPKALLEAMAELGLLFVGSARDLFTPISPDAVTNMTGLLGVSLIYPQWIQGGRLVHIATNFQATSPIDRAFEIIDCGGLLAIKAHIIKSYRGHVSLDGVDELYRNYLDLIFAALRRRYGDSLWWTSMGEIADRMHHSSATASQPSAA